ncbi:unnamed protein product [Discosporangium mesarthrocarpum]
MDIYADLPSADKAKATASGNLPTTKGSASGGWAHSKFQGMIAKRTSAQAASTRMAPPSLVKRQGLSLQGKGGQEKSDPNPLQPPTHAPPSPSNRPPTWDMGFGDVEDPYDPAHPNDYVEYCNERINKKLEEEKQKELKKIMEEQERERKRQEEERAATILKIKEAAAKAHAAASAGGVGGGGGGGSGQQGAVGAGAGGPPPNIAALSASMGMGRGRGRGLSNLPAWMTKGAAGAGGASGGQGPGTGQVTPPMGSGQFANAHEDEKRPGVGTPAPSGDASGEGRGDGSGDGSKDGSKDGSSQSFAKKMMAKMGYKEGQGLGRSQQGISRPLMAQSVGGGMGMVDMHHQDKKRAAANLSPPAPVDSMPQPPRKKRGLFSNPTRVLLLKNMVGPGEVDDALEGETQGECEKFGPVRSCMIYELKGAGVLDTEAVRIFVAFEKQESAVKAYLEMHGRFFGGRQITASFYKEDKFNSLELGPQPDEKKSSP